MPTIASPIPDFSTTSLLNFNSQKNTLSPSPSRRQICCRFRINTSRKIPSIVREKSNRSFPFFTRAMEGTSTNSEELYVAREPQLDEEYWGVAWLRGECHWEGREDVRNVEDLKLKFADKEFDRLKERCNAQLGNKCKCIMMVRKEDGKGKEILVSRIVGSLDLHTKYFSPGRTFPVPEEDFVGPPPVWAMDTRGSNSYGYITSLCVAKAVRRQGLASTMLQHAISIAKDQGMRKVFLRVYRENEGAMGLYEKMGFKKVEAAANIDDFISSLQPLLMCFELST